jgi:hypothetical protein
MAHTTSFRVCSSVITHNIYIYISSTGPFDRFGDGSSTQLYRCFGGYDGEDSISWPVLPVNIEAINQSLEGPENEGEKEKDISIHLQQSVIVIWCILPDLCLSRGVGGLSRFLPLFFEFIFASLRTAADTGHHEKV